MISWTVLSFLASSFATFPKASFNVSKAHSVAFTSALKVFFFSSHSQVEKALHHHSVRAISVTAAFHLLQVLSGWRFQLPLALYSCLSFSFSLLWKICLLLIVLGKNIPTSLVLSFSNHFPQPSTMRLFPCKLPPLPLCRWFISFCHERNCCSIAGMNWPCMIPHLPLSPPTQTARS